MDDMNLVQLIQKFADEKRCRAYIEALRWPNGAECPRCKNEKAYRIVEREQFVCSSCEYQFSATSGTIFHDSHLPLWKWFLTVYLMMESKKAMSANQMKRTLAVSYKTAWYLCHRIRKSIEEAKVKPSIEEWARGGVHTNGIENAWSLFKRSVVGSYHQISRKHMDAYLDEFEWRFNNRKNPYLFRDTILRLIASPSLEYKKLTTAA